VNQALLAQFEAYSLLFIYAAMALLMVALVVYSFELSRLATVEVGAEPGEKVVRETGRLHSVGNWLMIISTSILGVGVVLRGVAAERVPWANMYEFSITGAFLLLLVYLTALKLRELRLFAALVSGSALLILGAAVTTFYVEVKSLMPALQHYWLVIHVITAVLATAFFNIAAALHGVYLFKGSGWLQRTKSRVGVGLARLMGQFAQLKTLERIAYRFNIVGFVMWTFTLIAGAIWAERAWHRYWGWDTKEVWTFIIWVLYAGYLHAMATRGWSGKRAAWLGLVAFAAVIFNFVVVNLYFEGLHVYSGL